MEKLSIIIPVRNKEYDLNAFLIKLHSSLHKFVYEIIFIDEGASNKNILNIKKLAKYYPISFYKKNGEKLNNDSLTEVIKNAQFNIVIMLEPNLKSSDETILKMLELLDNDADITVENRIYGSAKQTKSLFQRIFVQNLFNLVENPQLNIIAFKINLLIHLSITSKNIQDFRQELIYKAKKAGFIVKRVDIVNTEKNSIKFYSSKALYYWRFLINALRFRLMLVPPVPFRAGNNNKMIGAGIRYNGNVYITHSSLHHSESALQTIIGKQKVYIILIILIIILAIAFNTIFTVQLLLFLLSFIYFADVLFSLFLVCKSLYQPQEITFLSSELSQLQNDRLKTYTILCPLYKEAHIIPQFVDSISKLDYPKEKLDVILLLEEDDKTTITIAKQMNLPSYFRILLVPDSVPKTKPKACNYGLAHAKGEYLVIYDAEDIPDPLQLKKAYLAFQKVNKSIICLQAKLNYYNSQQNLLTRFFTAEYSLWFDVTLTGLQSLKTSIPLGGTSNHFRIAHLRKLEGWDPFNVTEDADLGLRLFRQGYQTAIIDSTTLEEANSQWGNWLRQRSRWIKGYMQTYLVHCRNHTKLIKKTKWHTLIFHLVIGGKIAFILINPLLWVVTIFYFTLYSIFGRVIDSAFPAPTLYLAIISLVLGNSLFLFYYMIGCAKKEQWDLIKYIFLIPIYWIMISVAGGIAFYQLIFKPHYWEKTVHGLHLSPAAPEIIIELVKVPSFFRFPGNIRKQLISLKKGLFEKVQL